MEVPQPGHPSRGSTTGRPVMALLDVLGRRGSLRILWELRDESLTFRALQSAADTNPGVLNSRLKELRGIHVVTRGENGYQLSELGRSLVEVLQALNSWADQWADELAGRSPVAEHDAGE